MKFFLKYSSFKFGINSLHNIRIIILLVVLFSTSLSNLSFSQCSGCTITSTPNGNYNLNNGDVLCVPSGQTFVGVIGNLQSGSKICISPGAVFNPNQINNASGRIDNYGTANIPGFSLSSGFVLNNYNTINFLSSVNWNGPASFFNAKDATMNFNNNFALKNNSTFINEGSLIGLSDFETENGTTLINRAFIKTVGGNFNPNGTVNNNGSIVSEKFININSNARITNECSMVADRGFNNNSPYTINNGYFVVTGKYGFPDDLWQNNQSFTQGPNGTVSGIRFFNTSTIQGSGNYYFTGDTRNQGNFGQDAMGINFYDSSHTGSQVMDVVSPTPHSSVSKNSFVPPTSSQYNAGGCSGIINPVVASNDSSVFKFGNSVNLTILTNDGSGSPLNLASVSFVPSNNAFNVIVDTDGDVVSFEVPSQGKWSVSPLGVVTFMSTGNVSPTPIQYNVKNTSGTLSNLALISLQGSPLSVKLHQFYARQISKNIEINWVVNNDVEYQSFEVQRSRDSKTFETIGLVSYNKNGNYNFSDVNPLSINYYRIKLTQNNGSIDYSKILSFKADFTKEIIVTPTIVENNIKIDFKNGLKAKTIKLYDSSGILIKILEAENSIHDLSTIPTALYFLNVVTTDEKRHTFRLIKK